MLYYPQKNAAGVPLLYSKVGAIAPPIRTGAEAAHAASVTMHFSYVLYGGVPLGSLCQSRVFLHNSLPLPLSLGTPPKILCASSRTTFGKSTSRGRKNAQQSQEHHQLVSPSQKTSPEPKPLFYPLVFASPYSLGRARFALPILARQGGFAPAAPPKIIEARQVLVLLVVAETETGILEARKNLSVLEPTKYRLSIGGGI